MMGTGGVASGEGTVGLEVERFRFFLFDYKHNGWGGQNKQVNSEKENQEWEPQDWMRAVSSCRHWGSPCRISGDEKETNVLFIHPLFGTLANSPITPFALQSGDLGNHIPQEKVIVPPNTMTSQMARLATSNSTLSTLSTLFQNDKTVTTATHRTCPPAKNKRRVSRPVRRELFQDKKEGSS